MRCEYCESDAAFACGDCGKGLCWNHARLKVVCTDCIPKHAEQEIRIRSGSIEDKPFVERNFKEVLLLSDEDLRDEFDEDHSPPNHSLFIAEVDNTPVGFASLAKTSEVQGWLGMMAILPSFQRRGIGDKLVNAVINKARELGLKQLVVTTSNENVPALMLYMKHGFKTVSVKHDVHEKHGIRGFGVPGFDDVRLEMKLRD